VAQKSEVNLFFTFMRGRGAGFQGSTNGAVGGQFLSFPMIPKTPGFSFRESHRTREERGEINAFVG